MLAVVLCIYLMIIPYNFYHNFFPYHRKARTVRWKTYTLPHLPYGHYIWCLHISFLTTSMTNKHTLPEGSHWRSHWCQTLQICEICENSIGKQTNKKPSLIQTRKDSSALERNTQTIQEITRNLHSLWEKKFERVNTWETGAATVWAQWDHQV